MELTQTFEDKEVRKLLVGGEADVAMVFTEIDSHLRRHFVKGLRDQLRR